VDSIPLSTLYVVLFVLLILSAFFSISETSMMALNRYRLKHLTQSGHRGAQLATQLLSKVDRFLGVVLLGNNLINAAATLLVGEIARRYLGDSEYALFIATCAAGFAILIFSEITPKIIGASYPERIALRASFVLVPLLKIMRPVVSTVNLFVQALLRLLWVKPNPAASETQLSLEELRTLVLEAGYIPKKHQSILLNLFELESITVDDVMVPRSHIEAINIESPLEDIVREISTAYHRRVLVYQGRLEEIVGTVRVRSVLMLMQQDALDHENLRKLVWEPYFIPSGTPLFSQLQNFQEHQDRVSLVVDEYGELKGLVTLEDILEEIIGEFTTNSPLQARSFHREADGSYLVEGGTLLRQLNRKLGYDFPLDGPKTLNGLILEHLREIPEPNTGLQLAGYRLQIVQTQDRVVKAVRLYEPAERPTMPPSAERAI
jgi:Mg2+/Co2+ transporter CorB